MANNAIFACCVADSSHPGRGLLITETGPIVPVAAARCIFIKESPNLSD